MKSTELFCKAIYEEVKSNADKNIVLMAGASSSGKSYTAKSLAKYFNSKGKKSITIEADNYYKGLSRIIVEKAILFDGFKEFKERTKKISSVVKRIIGESGFNDKFSSENYQRLLIELQPILKERTAEFVEAIKVQKDNMNFDEPFAIDFNLLVNDINTLSNGGKINKLKYSFDTSEAAYQEEVYDARDNDVLVVEGLYALRDEVLDYVDYDRTIKCAVNFDPKTLMSRRFHRDIGGGRKTSLTPGQTITSFITNVMPAYYRFIKPTMMFADYTLDTSLTPEEINSRKHSGQFKFRAPEDIRDILNKSRANLVSFTEQVDYFLQDDNKHSNITLRIREIGGKANNLCFKIGDNINARTMDEYDLSTILDDEQRDMDIIMTKLKNSGFTPTDILRKKRKVYDVDGIQLKVDDVKDLGTFVEIDTSQFNQNEIDGVIKALKFVFRLDEEIESSYRAIMEDNVSKKSSIEVERKFKLEMTEAELSSLISKRQGKQIEQYYLNMFNPKVQDFLNRTFSRNLQFKDFGEARIRFVNKEQAYATMKARGKSKRLELEREIPKYVAEDYIQYSLGEIKKKRYIIHKDHDRNLTIELDVYENMPLILLEVEYDPEKENADTIKQFVEEYLSSFNINLKDVTSDRNYKNKNLATPIME